MLLNQAAKVPPLGVALNAYDVIHYPIVLLTMQYGAMFVHGRTDTLYFAKEYVERFGNA